MAEGISVKANIVESKIKRLDDMANGLASIINKVNVDKDLAESLNGAVKSLSTPKFSGDAVALLAEARNLVRALSLDYQKAMSEVEIALPFYWE